LNVHLSNQGEPINLEDNDVFLYGIKPDGFQFYNHCEIIDPLNGNFMAELTDQVLAVAGCVTACFVVLSYEGIEILKTFDFHIEVVPSVYSVGAVESSNEFDVLATSLVELNDAKSAIHNMSDRIGWPHPTDAPNLTLFDWFRNIKTSISNVFGVVTSIFNNLNTLIAYHTGGGFDQRPPGGEPGDPRLGYSYWWYRPHESVRYVRVTCVGGGAGGQGGLSIVNDAAQLVGEGGGAGGFNEIVVDVSHVAVIGSSSGGIRVSVGNGGLGGTGGGSGSDANGSNGQDTSFGTGAGTLVVGTGGRINMPGGSGASIFYGGTGTNGTRAVSTTVAGGGVRAVGGGSSGYGSVLLAKDGSDSTGDVFIGRQAGRGYGAGGGGGGSARGNWTPGNGGNGARGIVIIQPI
jgi:hypothetical protein